MSEADGGRRYTHTAKGCFGCGDDNPAGLALRPYHDGDAIAAEFDPKPEHRGFSRVVHGGVVAALLDEITTCAASIAAGDLVATASLSVEFQRPMPLGARYLVRARASGVENGRHTADGEIRDASGHLIARARGTFVLLSPERARRFLDPAQ